MLEMKVAMDELLKTDGRRESKMIALRIPGQGDRDSEVIPIRIPKLI
jgi:hypothetical protein